MAPRSILSRLNCFGCCGLARGSPRRADASDMESRPMLDDDLMNRSRGPIEVQHALKEVDYFEAVELLRYSGEGSSAEAEGFVKCDSPNPVAHANGAPPSTSAKIEATMITNYLDTLGSAHDSNQFTLLIKGPLRVAGGEEGQHDLLRQLDELETLLLDEADTDRIQLLGVKVCELEIRFPLTSFLNNLLTSGTVKSVTFTNCTVTPPVLNDGVHLARSTTITHITFKSCGLTDAHMQCFIKALKSSGAVLPNLQSLAMTGNFTTQVLEKLLTIFEEDADALRALAFPRRHEGFIKSHGLATARPHLLLNNKKVRHSVA